MVALILALLEHLQEGESVKECLMSVGGHNVILVDSFIKAKAVVQDSSFDLIISDVHLENGGTVFDFLKWVKSHPRLNTVPFVLLSLKPTGPAKYLSDGVRTASRVLGAAKYISMDVFDPVLLAEELSEFLPPQPKNDGKATKTKAQDKLAK